MRLVTFIERMPWTKTVTATFLLIVLATTVAVFVGWTPVEGWFTFVLFGTGVGTAGTVGKRAATKADVIQAENGR